MTPKLTPRFEIPNRTNNTLGKKQIISNKPKTPNKSNLKSSFNKLDNNGIKQSQFTNYKFVNQNHIQYQKNNKISQSSNLSPNNKSPKILDNCKFNKKPS